MSHPSTFSIVAYDPANGDLGIAVASKFLAVGSVVPWAQAGVGAIATQSWANTRYPPLALEMLKQGLTPEQVGAALTASDADAAQRQFGIVDARGRGFTFTGAQCFSWAGGIVGENFAAQGNILAAPKWWTRSRRHFKTRAALWRNDYCKHWRRAKRRAATSAGKRARRYLSCARTAGTADSTTGILICAWTTTPRRSMN